ISNPILAGEGFLRQPNLSYASATSQTLRFGVGSNCRVGPPWPRLVLARNVANNGSGGHGEPPRQIGHLAIRNTKYHFSKHLVCQFEEQLPGLFRRQSLRLRITKFLDNLLICQVEQRNLRSSFPPSSARNGHRQRLARRT